MKSDCCSLDPSTSGNACPSSKTLVRREIRKGIIFVDEQGLEKIAGLSNVVRLVCSFKIAGFDSVVIHGGEYADAVKEELKKKKWDLKVTVLDSECPGEEDDAFLNDGPMNNEKEFYLGVCAKLVIDPVFLNALLERWRQGETDSCFQIDSALWIDTLPCNERIDINRVKDLGRLSSKGFSGTFLVLGGAEKNKEDVCPTAEEYSLGDKKTAKKALLLACRKPVNIDGLVCSLIGRPISRLISGILLELPVKPNHVTAASLVFGLVGALIAAMGNYWPMLIGAALVFFSWVLDNCDGEIARVKYTGSRFGAWFDIYADFITNIAFIGGMSIGLYRSGQGWVMLMLGGYVIAAQSVYNGVVFRHIHKLGIPDEFLFTWWFDRGEACAGESKTDKNEDLESSLISRSFSYIKYLGRRDFFIFAYLVAALSGILDWALWATALGSTYSLVLTVVHLFKTKGDSVES